jgi:hypothetical protein
MRSAPDHGEREPLGTPAEVLDALARFNTAPDGSGRDGTGVAVLHGPGFVVEIPSGADEVSQALATLVDEDLAFPVLSRACRALGWTMVDLDSGRTFA